MRAWLMQPAHQSTHDFHTSTIDVLHGAPTVFAPFDVRNGEEPLRRLFWFFSWPPVPPFLALHNVPVEAVPRLHLAKHDVIDLHLISVGDGLVRRLIVVVDTRPQRITRASVAHEF